MTPAETAQKLAEQFDDADHVLLRDVKGDAVGNSEFLDRYITGDDHNLVVTALRAYAKARSWGEAFGLDGVNSSISKPMESKS